MLVVVAAVHILAELWAQAVQEEAVMVDQTQLAQLQQVEQINLAVVAAAVAQTPAPAAMAVMA
jgi:hypothetical protein